MYPMEDSAMRVINKLVIEVSINNFKVINVNLSIHSGTKIFQKDLYSLKNGKSLCLLQIHFVTLI